MTVVVVGAWLSLGGRRTGRTDRPAEFVGSATCVRCHERETLSWGGSHHDLAMAPANEKTVLGDFENATFEGQGMHARFFRRDGKFFVETESASGAMRAFEIRYTFGVTPLQQYLIEFPDGRLQALTVAWDARPAEQGGQRWFHLQPDEQTPPGDELHWTSPAYNWNHACAECHSTNVQKNYNATLDTFSTTWTDIDVSCEACHGPGSRHVTLASALATDPDAPWPSDRGLAVQLRGGGVWEMVEGSHTAVLRHPAEGDSQVEACGRCHSRRMQIGAYEHGRPLLETHWPALLDDVLYFADGQIRDEVYVYGSFLQSRMYAMGVTCSDCHDPHSLTLRRPGNAVCTSCHDASVFDSPSHHFHEQGTPGASCVECHMPSRTYMVVDPRRDHSMRIPRPDLTVALGVPNACNQCHVDQSAEWAAEAIVEWYGEEFKRGTQTYGHAFAHARIGAAGAGDELVAIATDRRMPTIARATAIRDLGAFLDPAVVDVIEAGLRDEEALIRRAAAEALEHGDAQTRWSLLFRVLDDPVRSVRLAAASHLLDIRAEMVEPSQRDRLTRGLAEYEAAQMFNAERAESWVNLAQLHVGQGRVEQAERAFAEARRRDRRFVPIYVNQADLYRALGREADAERVLSEGLSVMPDAAGLRHSLGLLYVRTGRKDEALGQLAAAARLSPEDARMGYVYGVALQSSGQVDEAIEVWQGVLERHPNERDVLAALAMALHARGDRLRAVEYAERLGALMPDDPDVKRLLDSIRADGPPG